MLTLQKKKVKRKKSKGEKKPPAPETSPEALEETWKIVEEELKASGFQVSVRIHLKGEQRDPAIRLRKGLKLKSFSSLKRATFTNTKYQLSVSCVQLSESLTESIVPFDATSETPLEEQRTEAMVRVQDALLVRQGPEALALLRAARSVKLNKASSTPQTNHTCFSFLNIYHLLVNLREVWPEGDVFGSSDVDPEEELELLKQILHANLPSKCFFFFFIH